MNNDPQRQTDEAARAQHGPHHSSPVDVVYCTKWGTTRRGEMYIVGGHMDGIGYGEAANDDGSGTAIVMELARIFNAPVSRPMCRFVSHSGIARKAGSGCEPYVAQRRKLQGAAGTEVARHGPARHDDVGPRNAQPRRHSRNSARGQTSTSSSARCRDGNGGSEARGN